MAKLSELLLTDGKREALVRDITALVERHVERKGGLKGITLRTGMAAVRRKLPDAIPRTVTRLLPDLLQALEPLHERSGAKNGRDFAAFLKKDPRLMARTMMGIADARVERSTNAGLKSFYSRFRGTAESEAGELVAPLADALGRHL